MSRQDWSEAARFFLVGLGHNNTDSVPRYAARPRRPLCLSVVLHCFTPTYAHTTRVDS